MTHISCRVAMVLALLLSSNAYAQNALTAEEKEAAQDDARLDQGSGNGLGLPVPQILVKSDVAGDAIKLTFSTGADSWKGLSSTGLAISLNAPFNKKKKVGNFLTEAGLPGTASIDLAYSVSFLPSIDNVADERPSEEELTWARVSLRKACKQEAAKPDDCLGLTDRELAAKYGPLDAREVVIKYYDSVVTTMRRTDYAALTFTGSVGRDTLNYRDPATFTEAKNRNTVFSIGTAFGYVPHIDRPWGFFIGGELKRYYELPDEETRCPIGGAGATSVTCFTSAFAPAQKKTDAIAFAAARLNGSIIKLPVSAELKVAFEPKEDRWGVSLPVYFIKNIDGKLNGGFKVGWQSDTDNFTFGFFIGGAFDFLKL
jgi:hypothetical protein